MGGSNGASGDRDRISTAIYAALLLSFPADFRRSHGRDAIELFQDRLRAARRRGPMHLVTFWARNIVDAVSQGLKERHVDERGPRRRTPRSTMPAPPDPRGRRGSPFDGWVRNVRLTARNLARSPVYSLVVIAVFAFTIMAVSTIGALMESLLWKPLPFPEPDRLVFVGENSAGGTGSASVTSRFVLDAVRRQVDGLSGLAAFNIWEATLTGVGDPVRLGGAHVTWNYFDTLGVPPALGRSFNQQDGATGGAPVVMISHRLWRGRFGADPAAVGRRIELNGEPFEIVGVMPAAMETPDQYSFARITADVWRPRNLQFADPDELDESGGLGEPGNNWLRGVARLAPGVTLEQVDAQVETLRARIGEQYPRWAENARISVLPLQEQLTTGMRPALWILAGAVGLVLLVGSVNVMNLILSRTIDRGREFAIRTALGAGRAQLLAHGVLEALLLALTGGIVGVLMARWSVAALLAASPSDLPRAAAVSLGPATVAVALTLTVTAALLAGVIPGLRLLRHGATGDLELRTRAAAAAGGLVHAGLAAVQIALAVMLLVAAGLLTRSLQQLLRIDLGFDPNGVYVAQLDLPPGRYEDIAARTSLTEQLSDNFEARADVQAAGFVTSVPQHGANNFSTGFGIAGREPDPDAPTWAFFRGASPGYFDAAGLELRRGRLLEARDFKGGVPTAVVINEELERRYFDGESALGSMLTVFGQENLEVVGVVRDVHYYWPGDPPVPEIYVPWQGRLFTVFLAVKAAGTGADIPALMKHEVQALDPYLPMDVVWSLEDLTAENMAETRVLALLMAVLAGFTLFLSATGTYGVIAHMVSRRTQEIGVRMALGARAASVLGMVLGRVLRIALAGSLVGLVLAWMGARLLETLLFGVSAHDPQTFVAVIVFLLAASLLACLHPVRRATRVDPVIALRND
jgi:predicted permease